MKEELKPLICECVGGKKTAHVLLEKLSKTEYSVQCKKCGTKSQVYFLVWEKALDRPWRAYLTPYPRVEPHTGAWVTSPEHEKETVRAMGYHEAPHGINPDYDDAEPTRQTDISYDE